MTRGIFVTGGDGFVGRPLLVALVGLGRPIYALTRRTSEHSGPVSAVGLVQYVQGDLLRPETYREALRSCDAVVHLAAATGRAPAATHFRVNAEGTEILLRACRDAGTERFLFVSSIATTFGDVTGYHYALAKLQAELAVIQSGLRFAIVRPTIILGPGAPVLGALERLALLPVVVMPGPGTARVQPVHVDDVVRAIVAIAALDRYRGETFDIGGPDVLSIEALLKRIREARTGLAGHVLHVPLALIRTPLRLAEAIGLGSALPLSAGQLASFVCDGTVRSNPAPPILGRPATVRQMIRDAMEATPAPRASTPVDSAALRGECRVFTRHLLGRDPDEAVQAAYVAAHERLPQLTPVAPFDRALVGMARSGRLGVRLADSYAGLLARSSSLRKKLVLLLAILESRAPFHIQVDAPLGRSTAVTLAALAGRMTIAVIALVAGAIVLLPTRAISVFLPRGSR